MKINFLAAALLLFATASAVRAQDPYAHIPHYPKTLYGCTAQRRASTYPWHGPYYYTQWGTPVALVVPPNAELQTDYGWGVGATRTTRINHQFARPYPGPGAGGQWGFGPTPRWPSDTSQFGVYYVRGPWGDQ